MANFSQDVVAKAREFDRESAALKTRVHHLAKSLGLTSKETIEALGHAGIVVKSAASTINQNQLDAVLNFIGDHPEGASLNDGSAATKQTGEESAAKEKQSAGKPNAADEKSDEQTAAKSEKKSAAKKSSKKSAAKKATKKADQKDAPKAEKKADQKAAQSEAESDAAPAEEVTEKKDAKKASAKKSSAKQSAEKQTEEKQSDEKKSTTKKRATRKRAVKKTAGAPEETAAKDEQKDSNSVVEEAVEAVVQSSSKKAADKNTADTVAETAEKTSAEKASAEAPAAKSAAVTTRRGRRVRRAVRTTSAPVAEGTRETQEAQGPQDTQATQGEALQDIEPPIVPEPPVAEEQTAFAPIFLAPQAVPATAKNSATEDAASADSGASNQDSDDNAGEGQDGSSSSETERQPRPRRRRRGRGRRNDDAQQAEKTTENAEREEAETREEVEEPQAIKGSTRLEAQRRRRIERREESRKRHVISEAEFLARRESVERTMVVRERKRHDHAGIVTEVGVLEDDLLVEHFVTSDTQTTQIGNIYLGRVQNVLPSMEAAFIDIGTDRNGVIYVGDLNWKLLGTKSRSRKIEHALKAGDQILVQVSKDPIGHKGARLTTHISMAGRFLVYVPGGRSAGISRKLPEPERKRLKSILSEVTPEGSGTIIRTAAEGVSKEAIEADIKRLESQWQEIWEASEAAKAKRGAKPIALYEEPDMLVKVVRDVFNEDFSRLVVEGDRPWNTVTDYIGDLAPELEPRLQRYFAKEHGDADVFEHFRIDEQLAKALDRKVWLPSGGTLVIDRTEAMTVIDVNTGKFTGAGGNLEETVTRNNLEAAEEIVRQMRLRDLGGMIVVDFIDMVLPENQDLVLRRLKEALGRDRSRHEVSEVTSLGLVQMTRKRLGTGLLETFSTPCSCCNGRGLIIHIDPVEQDNQSRGHKNGRRNEEQGKSKRRNKSRSEHNPANHPAALAMHRDQGDQAGTSKTTLDDDTETNQRDKEAADKRVAAAVEAVIVSSGNDEPKPPRRRRVRKSQGRNDEQRQDGNGRQERRERDEQSDNSNDLAALAAAAVAEARAKDPEEPSDDRYMPQEGQRRRRRATRRRVAEHVAVDSAARDADDRDEEHGDRRKRSERPTRAERAERTDNGGTGGGRGDAERSSSASARRRRRRAVRRTAVNETTAPQAESQAASTTDVREPAEDDKGGNANKTAKAVATESQTYEEAKEAFERSPRRRRPTRGNSRSDRAPRREDFESTKPKADAEGSKGGDRAKDNHDDSNRSANRSGGGRRSGKSRVEVVAVQGTGARRNRRRAVRRVSSQSDAGATAPKQRQGTSNRATKPEQKQANRGAAATQKKPANRRRRVRRAVRRSGRN
ncbi:MULTISPECIES: translation initiation factor IF-2 N-terminal domain-containing protein [Corynebacterium]|uniref:Ribonuclease E n=1 Tax=Corynebacterium amycolatum TaxID=43765 RepID=A0AB38XY21_CORAY|nr:MULTISPECIES: translation initiation factor IF-2 N-terminal domain-containing protein [Corynebacterium]AIN82548.1 ribonuclease, Rne/Rng family domain protein [Corynebacterium sp. ATCC 6931]MBC6726504.1 ribonuclease E [Corynebacterium amycolatum]MDY7341516.1 translation initiation factor IF-2 N-terminal domain-containing protein [Corynebacterium amycolatum]OHR34608.1 ribonuclease E [Corynebacterium sp. HMSC074C04]QRP16565.1 translation initiation factor IF-2 N-terminal domain-containing prot